MTKKGLGLILLIIVISLTGVISLVGAYIPNGWWYGDWLVEKNINATVSIKTPTLNLGISTLTVDANGTLLVNGSPITPSSTTYYPNATSTTGGSVVNDTIELMQYYDDDDYVIIEGNGANPLTTYINFTGVVDFSQLIIREYYLGSASHNIRFEIWDYSENDWQSYYSIVGQSDYTIITVPVYDPLDHILGGLVRFRMYHVQNGISSHKLYIDFCWLIEGLNVGASTNLAGYARYNFGYNDFSGNGSITTTGDIYANNITSPLFVDYILTQTPPISDIWNYVTRTLTNLNDTRADMIDNLDVLLSTRATQASVDVIDGIVDSILADTNELQVDWMNGGRLDLLIDVIKAKTDTIVVGATQASVDTIDGIVDSILVDTNELQVDWVNGGRLDLLIDAIKAKTDTIATTQQFWEYTTRTVDSDIFGTGADGDVTISVDTTLTIDKNYNTLTVNTGITLNTASYVVRVRNMLINRGIITAGFIGTGGTAGTGGNNANGGAGGAGNVPTTVATSMGTFNVGLTGGGGGGGSGGQAGVTGGNGGVGGKSGGVCSVFARFIVGTGDINANGQMGGNGVAGSGGGPRGGGGGGGGGSGGVVWIICRSISDAVTTTVTGGVKGGIGGKSDAPGGTIRNGGAGGSVTGVARDFDPTVTSGTGGAGGVGAAGSPGVGSGSGGGGGGNSATAGFVGGVGADGMAGILLVVTV